jgi:pyridoxal 5'-phosphate synthase pdxS subunit
LEKKMNNTQYELNCNLAQMLKGGVIMDVTNPEQAKIAEDAGACAVMALERIPADIRAAGGVSRTGRLKTRLQQGRRAKREYDAGL